MTSVAPPEIMVKHEPSKLTQLDGRVVGGVEARIEDFPYQVSVQYAWRHICGGALIGSKFILTAAHCTDGVTDPNLFKIRAGSSLHNSGGIMRSVRRIYQHPQYNSINIDYDVTVLEMNNPIFFSKIARPVPLIDAGIVVQNGAMSIVSGWGYLSENGQGPQKLHAVEVPIVSRERCNKAYGEGVITERMICAGHIDEGGKDACQGDSGGPLVSNGKLVGIVSWGYGCARPKFPGVYTNVAAIRDYVNQIHK